MTIAEIRKALGLTQVAFAKLFGVHSITVSKWECKKLKPSPWQADLIENFNIAAHRKPILKHATRPYLRTFGPIKTVYKLLRARYESK